MFNGLGSHQQRKPNMLHAESVNDRYAYILSMWDSLADLERRYQLLYYASDNSIEMFDMRSRKLFLKRMKFPEISLDDLVLGNVVTIHARQMTVVEYADEFTKGKFQSKLQTTLALVKPDAEEYVGHIMERVYEEGLKISKLKMIRLKKNEAEQFYAEHRDKPFFDALVTFMSSGMVTVMELLGVDAISKWRKIIGPTSTNTAKRDAPTSIRARFGHDETKNAVHGSDSPQSAKLESTFFFGEPAIGFDHGATFNDVTLCIVKPHAVASGVAGSVVRNILEEGFEISAMQMFNVDQQNAADFYEIYKGVVPEYKKMVEELSNGHCIVMEICGEGKDTVELFRQVAGPADPELARHIRPKTIRARFGRSKIENAVHCTDLEDDGVLEVQFFFHLLQKH